MGALPSAIDFQREKTPLELTSGRPVETPTPVLQFTHLEPPDVPQPLLVLAVDAPVAAERERRTVGQRRERGKAPARRRLRARTRGDEFGAGLRVAEEDVSIVRSDAGIDLGWTHRRRGYDADGRWGSNFVNGSSTS